MRTAILAFPLSLTLLLTGPSGRLTTCSTAMADEVDASVRQILDESEVKERAALVGLKRVRLVALLSDIRDSAIAELSIRKRFADVGLDVVANDVAHKDEPEFRVVVGRPPGRKSPMISLQLFQAALLKRDTSVEVGAETFSREYQDVLASAITAKLDSAVIAFTQQWLVANRPKPTPGGYEFPEPMPWK